MTRRRAVVVALAIAVALPALPLPSPAVAALDADPSQHGRVSSGDAGSGGAGGEPIVVGALVDTGDGPVVERHEVDDQRAAQRLAEELRARPGVVAADVSALLAHHATDPYRPVQWALDELQAEAAWTISSAEGTRIAVVDSGVHGTHPDLVNVLVPGYDSLAPSGDGLTDTSGAGHGTRVAGVAGAEVGNGIGMAGLAKDAQLVPVRVLDDKGFGDGSRIAEGVLWAADAGVDVINLSLGGRDRDDVLAAAVDHARRQGVVVVASSGNSAETGNPTIYPAAEPGVVAVGGVGREGRRAAFSSYGDWLDLVAPGEQITTTCPPSLETGAQCTDGYHQHSAGTSFAAPFVSASAALLRARYPRALPSQIAWRLTDSAEELKAPRVEVGAGLVDPLAALTGHPDLGCRTDAPEAVVRSWDVGRVETAVAVACSHWPEGATPEVVLATARDFPDALAGAALAAARDIPLLLTEPRSIPAHLDEVLVQLGAERVYLLGGRGAVGDAVQTTLEGRGIDVRRIAGDDRYASAARIAERAAPGGAAEVLVASGEGFADAVAAGAFQGARPGTPLLLTRRDRLPSATAEAIRDLAPGRVNVIGGPAAVGQPVLDEIAGLGPRVSRLGGRDRYETSATVTAGLGTGGPLLVASGDDFPDALAAGALAGRVAGRLLLVPPEPLPAGHPTTTALSSEAWDRVEIVGGPSAVSDEVEARLRDLYDR